VNEHGTLDEAVIGIPYFSTGDDIVVELPVSITLDEAPPQGTLYKTFPGLDVPSGAYFHVGPSEPFLAPGREEGGLYVRNIGREDWLLSLTRLVDGEGVELPAKTHKDVIIWMYEFDDSDDLAGKTMHLEVSEAMQSFVGDSFVADPVELSFLAHSQATRIIDFDDGLPEGAHGDFTYHPPGESNSPCESGGCLELRDPGSHCDDFPREGPSGLFHALIGDWNPYRERLLVRHRILSDQEWAPLPWFWHEPYDCSEPGDNDPMPPLDDPMGEYTHGSEWTNRSWAGWKNLARK
jgi:hypothetical protein